MADNFTSISEPFMRAVRCHRFAGLDEVGKPLSQPKPLREVLSLDTLPTPDFASDEVLIQTHFAGVQYPDALQAQGLYQVQPELPYVPGADLTGFVIGTGDQVTHVRPGDPVIAQVATGALAELTVASSSRVWKVPQGVELSRCANLGRNYFAAYHSLHVISGVREGNLVLIDGASGGVGMAGIQLAKAMGARVIAAVSTEEKTSYPREAGADVVLTYGQSKESYRRFKSAAKAACAELGHPDGADCILDMVQGDLFETALLSCIRPLGHVCLIGFTAGQRPIRPGMILIKQASVVGSLWSPWAQKHPEAHRKNVAQILEYFASKRIVPLPSRIIPLDRFVEAFELYENNQGRGNTVVQVAANS